ncbi:MAG: hypothetical protein Ta2B_01540 [Termitinemataceae bacterium]|nr:MAG: hypothetical protein Ta2B_01540 [Termitinemataceae bacterium]
MRFKFFVFSYDTIRFLVFFLVLSVQGKFNLILSPSGASEINDVSLFFLPHYSYVASIALFPIMSFFLWLDSKKNRVFLSLYIAGKIINACAVITPFAIWITAVMPSVHFWTRSKLLFNLTFPAVIILDLFSILILYYSIKNDSGNSSSTS